MRSVTRSAVVALAFALGACGNYSTEDLRFLAALPRSEDLQVGVPSGGSSGAVTVCGSLGAADVWLKAKPISDGLNRGVEFVISLVDVVRRYPPADREDDLRRWGPFPSDKHPGREIQVTITRAYPYGADGPPVHDYRFEARVVGDLTFTPLIVGSFTGASSSRGHGTVDLYFENFWSVGMNEDTTPHGTMHIEYHRDADPVLIDLGLTNGGFDVVQFGYQYTGYADGQGAFQYAFEKPVIRDRLVVTTGYDASGAGRAEVTYTPADGSTPGGFRQCWDAAACLTYVDDPGNFSCPLFSRPCSGGDIGQCPAVRIAPF